MLDRPSSQSHSHDVHPILAALIIRSFPSPSLHCLPPSPSSILCKKWGFQNWCRCLPSSSFPYVLSCAPLFIYFYIYPPPLWWLRLTNSNAVRLYSPPCTHNAHKRRSSSLPWTCRSPGPLCPAAVAAWGTSWSQRWTQRTHQSRGPGPVGAEGPWSAEEHTEERAGEHTLQW